VEQNLLSLSSLGRPFLFILIFSVLPLAGAPAITEEHAGHQTLIQRACSGALGIAARIMWSREEPIASPAAQTKPESIETLHAITRRREHELLPGGHYLDAGGMIQDEKSYAVSLKAQDFNRAIAAENLVQLVRLVSSFDITLTLSAEEYFRLAAAPVEWEKMIELIRFGFDFDQGIHFQASLAGDLERIFFHAQNFDFEEQVAPKEGDGFFTRLKKATLRKYFEERSHEIRKIYRLVLELEKDIETIKQLRRMPPQLPSSP
jgi:hypothetical protein